ncbi:MAG: serine racemase VanT catalytic subunit [Clostridiales bacterium]|nr:serine racemase VanT catalytic subunit [Clostridiales bacterium]
MTPLIAEQEKSYGALDLARLAAAFLVIAIHTSPLLSLSEPSDVILTRIIARIAVPLFFMISGFFALRAPSPWHFIRKNLLLYLAAMILYLPIGIYAGHYTHAGIGQVLQMLLWDGTFYHLWYLPACITGMLIVYFLEKHMPIKIVLPITFALYLIGLFGDSYYGLIVDTPVDHFFYQPLFHVFSYTRNGFFFAPFFIALGALCQHKPALISRRCALSWLPISLLCLISEGLFLHRTPVIRHDSMYLFLIPVLYFIFTFLQSLPIQSHPVCRSLSTWIYIVHPLAIILVRAGAKPFALQDILVQNSLIHYIAVCLVSLGVSFVISDLFTRWKNPVFREGRAWIELDRAALIHNIEALRTKLPPDCTLMPVLKANAYGHGAALLAKELQKQGINIVCVATAAEGAALRKQGFRQKILVLGYTHPKEFTLLRRYRLMQTVIDAPYAAILNQDGRRFRVHIGIDTGMHRLGEPAQNSTEINQIFQMKHLSIDGICTHFSTADNTPEGRAQTHAQIEQFQHLLGQLQEQGCQIPKTHLQASYGLLYFPDCTGSYARVGIALYGLLSSRQDNEHCPLPLQPVLSLKARVASVKTLQSGDTAGYGSAIEARQEKKIAILSIGYADGLPRTLSEHNGRVLLHGCEAPILQVCMDLTMVDITKIPLEVNAGDTAVLIGRSENNEITAYELAEKTNTITNEILSRLGHRLARTIK